MLADTVTSEELLELSPHTLLRRLYHQERVRVFDPEPWAFGCTCSLERVEATLQSFGRAEVDRIVEEEGAIDVTCEFCGARYEFDAVEAAGLFEESVHPAPEREM